MPIGGSSTQIEYKVYLGDQLIGFTPGSFSFTIDSEGRPQGYKPIEKPTKLWQETLKFRWIFLKFRAMLLKLRIKYVFGFYDIEE